MRARPDFRGRLQRGQDTGAAERTSEEKENAEELETRGRLDGGGREEREEDPAVEGKAEGG